jgi:hypothetical protein
MNVNLRFPGRQVRTDLEWIVEIPDFENVVMDALNAIDQWVPLKENTFTQITPVFYANRKCY